MERVISQEERIRKAEEIYNRRRQEKSRTNRERYYKNESQTINIKQKMMRRLIIQILVCFAVYMGLYLLQNNNQLFSEDVNNKINEFISYDISFEQAASYFNGDNSFLNEFLNINKRESGQEEKFPNEDSGEIREESTSNEATEENKDEEVEETRTKDTSEASGEAVGGVEEVAQEENKSQEELDSEYIKNNYNIIWPIQGVITSRFGTRDATEIVSANHYGVDIAGNIGDPICAAMDGIVTYTSLEGDYGKHLTIANNNVTTLYAHCSELCVGEGISIKQGDKIAEIGQTRQSNRSAFTF